MKHSVFAGLALVAGVAVSMSAPAMADDVKKAEPKAMSASPGPVDLNAPLPSDGRLVTGTLPNGLSYIVLKHSNPPGRAAMWIHIGSGSLNEKDNQRGIAHFLEHMAFEGSDNFPPGSVVDFFQSMGLRFGQDQNAFTNFDQTTYQLSFPDTKPETLERGMRFFSDVGGRLLLTEKGINDQRQVIFEEKRTREGGQQRMQDYVLERLVPGSLIGTRLPIGTAQTLSSVQRPDFLDYYNHWYVPSNMTVMVVADADPAEIVSQIGKSFAGGEKKPKPPNQDVMVKPYQASRGIVASDPEQKSAVVQILSVAPKLPPVTTVGGLRDELVREIGTSAFDRRIGAKLNKGGTSYLSGRASAGNQFSALYSNELSINGKPENWKPMLAEMGTELQRARLHGFTEREIDDVKKELLSSAERFVEQEATMQSGIVVSQINNSVSSGDTIMGAKNELALYRQLLPTITPKEISETFARNFDFKNATFVAELPTGVPGGVPSESDLVAAGRAALDVTPPAEAESARASELMSSKPTPGRLLDVSTHEPSKVVSAWLDNGIRVHYRFMDIRKDDVAVHVSLVGGSIQETPATRGVAEVAALGWADHATSKLSSTDIRDLMVGKKVRVRGGGGGGGGGRGGGGGGSPDTMTLTIEGGSDDLEPGFQLAYLMFTDPVIEASAFERWKTRQLQFIDARKNVIEAAALEVAARSIYPPDEARTQPLTAEQVNKLTPEAGQKWLRNAIEKNPIEITIVGDIAQDKAMELVRTYFGSLPKRDRISKSTLADLRTLHKGKGPIVTKLEVPTETNKAFVINAFYTADATNVQDNRAMQAASRVISTRMFKKVREEANLAYSPRASNSPGETYPGFGIFGITTTTDPTKSDRLIALTTEMFQDFAKNGATDEEMDTIKKQFANDIDEQMKNPQYWVARTGTLDYRGVNLDDVMAAGEAYQKLTNDQLKAAFNKYYKPEATVQVIVSGNAPAAPKTDGGKSSMAPGN